MIEYSIKKNNIFYALFTGPISFEDIKNYLSEFKSINDLPENILLLYDLTDAEINISANDIQLISKLANDATGRYISVRTAFVVDKPKVTAYSYLFSRRKNSKKTVRRLFSSLEAATEWLLDTNT